MPNLAPGWGPNGHRRRRPPLKLVLLLVILPFVGGLFAAPAATPVRGDDLSDAVASRKDLEKQIADQKAQVAKLDELQAGLKTDIANTSKALKSVNADLAAVSAQVDQMTVDIAKVQAAYDGLVAQLGSLWQQLQHVEVQEAAKADQLAARKALLGDRIRAAYSTDQTSLLETFLSGDSFADILTQMGYYLDVGEQDKALALQIEQDQQALAELHASVEETRTQTDALRVETAKQKEDLDARLADLKTAKAQLKVLRAATARTLATQKSAYAKLLRNKAAAAAAIATAAAAQKKLQQKIDQIIAARQQAGNIPSQYNGTLQWPMVGTVSQNFGCTGFSWEPPLGSCAHFHQGIDIVAPYGTPVRASGDGTVVYIGWNYADGADPAWIVIIAHSGSLQTWYAHLQSKRPVITGEVVKAGDIIGYEGNTGHSTGAHLHWAVRFKGEFVNPRLFL